MIISEKELKSKVYIASKDYIRTDRTWDILKGSEIEITKFNGNKIKFRIHNGSESLRIASKQCLNRNLKGNKLELVYINRDITLWETDPDGFIEKDNVFGDGWTRPDGKKSKYSYLSCMDYFHTKEKSIEIATGLRKDIEEAESGSKDAYYEKVVYSCKDELLVEEFNEYFEEKL